MPFDPTKDSWAPGDPIPMISGPVAPDAQGLLARGASDLSSGAPLAQGKAAIDNTSAKISGKSNAPWPLNLGVDAINSATDKLDSLDPTSKTFDKKALGNAVGGDLAAKITEIQASFANWIPRLIVIGLGFIFVAVALAMFGINTGPGQEIVRGVRNRIPSP